MPDTGHSRKARNVLDSGCWQASVSDKNGVQYSAQSRIKYIANGDTMPAYVHVNLRVIDSAKQAALAPRFQAALEAAGGKILHFGPVAQILEGDEVPLPMAGVFEFPTLAQALAFYNSERYAPIKAERREAQQARMFIVETSS
jgi:uncharacterized protein (DUF1330 family)